MFGHIRIKLNNDLHQLTENNWVLFDISIVNSIDENVEMLVSIYFEAYRFFLFFAEKVTSKYTKFHY